MDKAKGSRQKSEVKREIVIVYRSSYSWKDCYVGRVRDTNHEYDSAVSAEFQRNLRYGAWCLGFGVCAA